MLARGYNPPPILRLDVAGFPVEWIPWQDAVCLYVKGEVAWEVGAQSLQVNGGLSRRSGLRSLVKVNSIIAVQGVASHVFKASVPHLTNRELFRRDCGLCMYCGGRFTEHDLTRDHIIPKSRGGGDQWTNVVSACKRCNTFKGARTPEEASMPLLAVPFVPNPAEYLALKNRRILSDQMDFLKKQFRHSRLNQLA